MITQRTMDDLATDYRAALRYQGDRPSRLWLFGTTETIRSLFAGLTTGNASPACEHPGGAYPTSGPISPRNFAQPDAEWLFRRKAIDRVDNIL